jgi:replicative DNA helicase
VSANGPKAPVDLTNEKGCERAVMGGFIIDAEEVVTLWRGATAMVQEDPVKALLRDPKHRALAAVVIDMVDKKQNVDYISLFWELKRLGKVDDCGGAQYVFSHQEYFWCPTNTRYHVEQLIDRWRQSQTVQICRDIATQARAGEDTNNLVATATERMHQLIKADIGYVTPSAEAAVSVVERLETRDEAGLGQIRWYWPELQRMTGGMRRQKLAVAIAPPNYGKTAFALNQATFAAGTLKKNVVAFLMESDPDEPFTRYAQQIHGVNGKNLTSQRLDMFDLQSLRAAGNEWGEMSMRLFFFHPGPISADQIDAALQKWKMQTGLQVDLLIVDHMNTMASGLPKVHHTDHHAISNNVLRLQEISVRENCATLILAQPAKEFYSDDSKKLPRPTMGHLKGSGTPIEAAKLILFLHYQPGDRDKYNICPGEFVVVKNNNGQPGALRTFYVQPQCLHIVDTPYNRAQYATYLQKFGGVGGHPEIVDDLPA